MRKNDVLVRCWILRRLTFDLHTRQAQGLVVGEKVVPVHCLIPGTLTFDPRTWQEGLVVREKAVPVCCRIPGTLKFDLHTL
jgi:hypothetical protein